MKQKAATRCAHRPDEVSRALRGKEKQAATRWRTAIWRAQRAYWKATFQSADRNMAFQGIRVGDRRNVTLLLPDIQGRNSFQGKCRILRDSSFPANVATPPGYAFGLLTPWCCGP